MKSFIKLLLVLSILVVVVNKCNAQTEEFKRRISSQDSALTVIFDTYLHRLDSVSFIWQTNYMKQRADSADKYIKISAYYLALNNMDSCIEAIHKADKYIVEGQEWLTNQKKKK